MPDEIHDTQSFEPAPPPPGPPPGPPGPPGQPPEPPPRSFDREIWPWLAVLLLLAVAGILIWLFVIRDKNSHPPVVPAVTGMQQQVAIKRLTDDGYSVRAIVGPAAKPSGIVVSQAPGGGSQLPKGSSVTLHVSNGHPVSVTTTPTKTTSTVTTTATTTTTTTTAASASIPNAVGQDMVSGAGQIEAAGFVANVDPGTASGTPGQILAESPGAGTQAPAGSIVHLQVAVDPKQPQVQVPSVLGQKAGAARAAILKAKLTVATEYKKTAAKYVGVVVAQRPAGGGPIAAYTQIVLTVGQ